MQRLSLILGFATLGALWLGPLPRLAAHSFAAHMGLHMGVVAIASGFLAIGAVGTRFDLARLSPRLVAPIPASALELIIVWAWHAPALHHAARHHWAGLIAEQGLFLASGFLVWISAFGGDAKRDPSRTGAGVLGLLLTSMHMTLLGALLALAPRPLYVHGQVAGGLSALDDQHLGGAIMLFVGGLSYLAGGLWLTRSLLLQRSAQLEAKP